MSSWIARDLATARQHKGQMARAEATMREALALAPPIDRVEFDQKLLSVFLLGRERWWKGLSRLRPAVGRPRRLPP